MQNLEGELRNGSGKVTFEPRSEGTVATSTTISRKGFPEGTARAKVVRWQLVWSLEAGTEGWKESSKVGDVTDPGKELGFYSHCTEAYGNCNLECDMIWFTSLKDDLFYSTENEMVAVRIKKKETERGKGAISSGVTLLSRAKQCSSKTATLHSKQ